MRGLDGKARIFIGSSSEGRAAAETTASALEAAGMRPLLWSEFFKTRDLVDADGAILVGSADDRLASRGEEFDQMRDNVLLEYGLFAGHLGRHRCVLLMPDDPRFRIPSDFLGVAGFELYTEETLDGVAKKVPERLQVGFAADGFKPPSLQERCRRVLLLSGWMRGEIAKIRLDVSGRSLKEQIGEKVGAVLCFLKEDIDTLGLREDATVLEELVRKSVDHFPDFPDLRNVGSRLEEEARVFLSQPHRYQLRSQTPFDRLDRVLSDVAGDGAVGILDRALSLCPWCGLDQSRGERVCKYPGSRPSIWDLNFYYLSCYMPHQAHRCIGREWWMGVIDMLGFLRRWFDEFDDTIGNLERWQQD
jgi:hypothetical protein